MTAEPLEMNWALPDQQDRQRAPLLVVFWFVLAGLSILGVGNPLILLSGIRFTHSYYYFEVLLLPTLGFAILLRGKAPLAVWLYLAWIAFEAVRGYLGGGFDSVIYDRSRVIAVLTLLIVLHKYRITSDQMSRLIVPVAAMAVAGEVIAVIWPLRDDTYLLDALNCGFLGTAYALVRYVNGHRFRIWYWPLIIIPLGYTAYLGVRGVFIPMMIAAAIPILFGITSLRFRGVAAIVIIIFALAIIGLFGPVSERYKQKDFFNGGLNANSLESTAGVRISEIVAFNGTSPLQLLAGRGLGASWDGRSIYREYKARERYTFHIYYFDIVYGSGLIGLLLFGMVFVLPVAKGLIYYRNLGVVGQVGVVGMVAQLLSFLNSASLTWNESFYYVTALYCIAAGSRNATGRLELAAPTQDQLNAHDSMAHDQEYLEPLNSPAAL